MRTSPSGTTDLEKREFKDRLYAEFARVGRALASPHRLELLDVLAQGERSVEELASEAALSIANASQHLRALHQAHLVEMRREGSRVYYRLGSPEVFALWQSLQSTAEARLAEIDRVTTTFLSRREEMEAVGPEELRRRLEDDDITVLDVRPALEYRQGHIAGAISLPLEELETRLAELPPGRQIVAYCRGPYCVYADEAVETLSRHGRSASRLVIGYPDWAASGLPIAVGVGGGSSPSRSGA
ncbi:MAG: transcriptional regulator, ArsR family [Chloroflexi bacterium]|nr:transcriptional regulator, ArsR family [Chloroflexota bacterium]